MNETRVNFRVDKTTKSHAEEIFKELGMSLSTGLNVYLAQVVRSRGIPFVLETTPSRSALEERLRNTIKLKNIPIVKLDVSENGHAVLDDKKYPREEYPNVYDWVENG